MKDLKEIHDKPKDKFDMELADDAEKSRRIKLYGLLASLVRGRVLALVKAVEDFNGLDAWSLNKALKPTSKAKGLALLGAPTTWPAFQ